MTQVTTWYWYRFRGCILHCVCAELRHQLVADLAERYGADANIEDWGSTTTWTIDDGGVDMQAPIERFTWFGLELKIPCDEVVRLGARLRALSLREFSDNTEHFKIKAWRSCIVVTPAQMQALSEQLNHRAEGAEQHATAYYSALVNLREDKDA